MEREGGEARPPRPGSRFSEITHETSERAGRDKHANSNSEVRRRGKGDTRLLWPGEGAGQQTEERERGRRLKRWKMRNKKKGNRYSMRFSERLRGEGGRGRRKRKGEKQKKRNRKKDKRRRKQRKNRTNRRQKKTEHVWIYMDVVNEVEQETEEGTKKDQREKRGKRKSKDKKRKKWRKKKRR